MQVRLECEGKTKRSPRLLTAKEQIKTRSFDVDSFPFKIGSGMLIETSFPDPMVSREHAAIRLTDEGRYVIRDLGSRNGTVVDGVPLKPGDDAALRNGSRIYVAYYRLTFVCGGMVPPFGLWLPMAGAAAALLLCAVAVRRCGTTHDAPDAAPSVASAETADDPFEALNTLSSWPPDMKSAAASLESLRGNGQEDVRRRADELSGPLRSLNDSLVRCGTVERLLIEMNTDAAKAADLRLPPTEVCAADPRLLDLRRRIEERFNQLRHFALLIERLDAAADGAGRPEEWAAVWRDEKAIRNVLACDSLAAAPPSPARTQPSGDYDRYLGIEDADRFFTVELGGRFQLLPVETPFVTVLATSRRIYAEVAEIVACFEALADSEWRRGPLGERISTLRGLLDDRDRLVRDMVSSLQTDSRQAIIAAAVAVQLSDRPDSIRVGDQTLKEWTRAEFLRLEGLLKSLAEEYDSADHERRALIRRDVLERGLPHQPLVNRLWHEPEA
jgi:hypothetical protein